MPRYSKQEAKAAVSVSRSYSETVRRLGLRPAGGNHALLKRWLETWGISTEHFDPHAVPRRSGRRATPLAQVMVEGSTYSRDHLKRRLVAAGLKQLACEQCGQDENWQGRRMSMILDHINGVANDHRFENLRMLCPNCAATLDTHCGRKNGMPHSDRACLGCGSSFRPRAASQRYCSIQCSIPDRARKARGVARPERRKAERPPYEQLLAEIERHGFSAVGRRYGVSDNAIRKWLRFYERQREREGRTNERSDAA